MGVGWEWAWPLVAATRHFRFPHTEYSPGTDFRRPVNCDFGIFDLLLLSLSSLNCLGFFDDVILSGQADRNSKWRPALTKTRDVE